MEHSPWPVIIILAFGLTQFYAQAVDVEKIRLVGDSNNYINLQSKTRYSLQCKFRAGYDADIQQIRWYKDGRVVYTWQFEGSTSRAYGPLIGKVETSDRPNLQNIHFSRTSLDLSGVYICEIRGKETTKSDPFHLMVLDLPSEDFKTSVSLLGESDVDLGMEANMTNPEDDFNCTLIWNFHTPAIFPRPNVTCGYYSYLLDDVEEEIPAGLTMHNLVNGSWQAGFDQTYIQIKEIPKESRLGCSVTVPETNFKRVVKFEDNFAIDHLIDSEGCPSVALDRSNRLNVDIDGGSFNCRGDLVPSSTTHLMKVTFSCPRGELAVFSNGSAFFSWRLEVFCNPRDMSWTTEDSFTSRSPSSNLTDLPACVPMAGTGTTLWASLSMTGLLSLCLFLQIISRY